MYRVIIGGLILGVLCGAGWVDASEPLHLTPQQRCGTLDPEESTLRWVQELIDHRAKAMPVCDTVVIPVHFHVIHDGSTGQLSQTDIDNQIAVLDAAYANYDFVLDSVDYTDNASWFNNIDLGNATEDAVKSALATDLETHLNIYTANPPNGTLGWAAFPWDFTGSGDYLDGVVLLYSSLPGGSAAPYNLGDTATHEVGHWLGLRHIWGDGGCGDDDFVADTPLSDNANFGCPTGHVSCSTVDQIENFMDYTDDACMTMFSADQYQRMCLLTELFRPGILIADQLCGNSSVDPGEQCDDGGSIGGDGCSASCQVEGAGEQCMTFASSDTPVAIATTPGQVMYTSELTVTMPAGWTTITDVNITNLELSHTYIGDLEIHLNSAVGSGIMLMDLASTCGSQDDVAVALDDSAAAGAWPCPPTSGTYQPTMPLARFNGENADGQWTLSVADTYAADGGSLDTWSLEVCASEVVLGAIFDDDFESGDVSHWSSSVP